MATIPPAASQVNPTMIERHFSCRNPRCRYFGRPRPYRLQSARAVPTCNGCYERHSLVVLEEQEPERRDDDEPGLTAYQRSRMAQLYRRVQCNWIHADRTPCVAVGDVVVMGANYCAEHVAAAKRKLGFEDDED